MKRQTKTPDEIKKGLECISRHRMDDCDLECGKCDAYVPGWTISGLCADARALIQQLEAKDAEKAKRIAELEKELAAVKRERDAAVADMRKIATGESPCSVCDNNHRNDPVCKSHQGDCSECSLHCPCDGCFDSWEMELAGNNFAWRGVCPENTEVQADE